MNDHYCPAHVARGSVAVCLAALCCASARADHPGVAFGSEAAGPINTLSAATLPAGTVAISLRNEFVERDQFAAARLAQLADGEHGDVHSVDMLNATSLSVAFAAAERLTVSLRLPWVSRSGITALAGGHDEHDHDHEGAAAFEDHGSADGLGDVVALASWQALDREGFGLALQAGAKAPTGATHERDGDERLETELQPGSGSWDAVAGVAVSLGSGSLRSHASVLAHLTGEGAQDTEIGDALFYNFAVVYAPAAAGHAHAGAAEAHRHLRWELMLELNGEKRWKNAIAGTHERNSGGNLVYLAPGVRLSYGAAGGFLSVGIPLLDDPNGAQTDVDYRLVGGLSYVF